MRMTAVIATLRSWVKCLWPFALATGYERRLVSNNTDGLNGAP